MKTNYLLLILLSAITLNSCAQKNNKKEPKKLSQAENDANRKRLNEKTKAEIEKKFGGPVTSFTIKNKDPLQVVNNTGNFNLNITPYQKAEKTYTSLASNIYTTAITKNGFTQLKIIDTVQKIRLEIYFNGNTSGKYPIVSPDVYYPQSHPNTSSIVFFYVDNLYSCYTCQAGFTNITIANNKVSGSFQFSRAYSFTATGNFTDINF